MGGKKFEPRVPKGLYGDGNYPPGFVWEDITVFFSKFSIKATVIA